MILFQIRHKSPKGHDKHKKGQEKLQGSIREKIHSSYTETVEECNENSGDHFGKTVVFSQPENKKKGHCHYIDGGNSQQRVPLDAENMIYLIAAGDKENSSDNQYTGRTERNPAGRFPFFPVALDPVCTAVFQSLGHIAA